MFAPSMRYLLRIVTYSDSQSLHTEVDLELEIGSFLPIQSNP